MYIDEGKIENLTHISEVQPGQVFKWGERYWAKIYSAINRNYRMYDLETGHTNYVSQDILVTVYPKARLVIKE